MDIFILVQRKSKETNEFCFEIYGKFSFFINLIDNILKLTDQKLPKTVIKRLRITRGLCGQSITSTK